MILPWLQFFRISGMPSALTGSLLGCILAELPLSSCILLGLAGAFFYCAGMGLNDIADLNRDRVRRPDRPLPSGILGLKQALLVCLCLCLISLGLAAICGLSHFLMALGLLVSIFSYNFYFKSHQLFSGLSMGLCRFFNYSMGIGLFLLMEQPILLLPGLGLFFHVQYIMECSKGEDGIKKSQAKCVIMLTLSSMCLAPFSLMLGFLWFMPNLVLLLGKKDINSVIGSIHFVSLLVTAFSALEAFFLFSLSHHAIGVVFLLIFLSSLMLKKKFPAG
ncbi:MAG: UbiA family prenyltransferase [Planctomycetes bacterium]|nr:UbiA family prenyltransferase [Planctomycetota bacterium]